MFATFEEFIESGQNIFFDNFDVDVVVFETERHVGGASATRDFDGAELTKVDIPEPRNIVTIGSVVVDGDHIIVIWVGKRSEAKLESGWVFDKQDFDFDVMNLEDFAATKSGFDACKVGD